MAQRAPHAEMALFAAMIRAGGWPDVGYTLCQVVGFPCVGDYRDSGLFRRQLEAAADTRLDLIVYSKRGAPDDGRDLVD